MTESRTYDATPRKLARATQRFGRPTSPALTAAIALGISCVVLPPAAASLAASVKGSWTNAVQAAQTPVPVLPSYEHALLPALRIAAVLAALALGVGVATWLQRGVFVRALASHAQRPNRAFVLLQGSALAAVLLWPSADAARGLLASFQRAPAELLSIASRVGFGLLQYAAISLALFGALDLALSHFAFRRRLRMSRHELLEEMRATEGDPFARAERRRRAHEQRLQATLVELSEVTAVVHDSASVIALRRAVVWIKAGGELGRRILAEANARGLPVTADESLVSQLSAFEPNEPLPNYLHLALPAAERGSRD